MAHDSDSVEEQSSAPSTEGQEQSIDALKAEIEKLQNEQLYLRAEFDNYRKQAIKERSDLMKYGSERLVQQLLGVLDNFDRALEMNVTTENYSLFVDGIRLTSQEFYSTLDRMGVKSIVPLNEAFDPAQHEALSSESTDQVPEGHVARVFRKGYRLHDKIIRPAQVVVATKPTSGSNDSNGPGSTES